MLMTSLLQSNLVPDTVIRQGIRRLLKMRLKEIYAGGVEATQERFSGLLDTLKDSPIAVNTQDANEQHYEVPAPFYQHVLGSHLKYSSGYWTSQTQTLDGAELVMLQKTLSRADIHPNMDVLDLGCGWGSFSLFAAAQHPDCNFTAVSNSASQRAFIEQQASDRGISNLRVVTADINDLQLTQQFDRVVSVEMFEHMRNYERLLAKVSSWLKDDGKLFVHIFTHRLHAYLFEVRDETDWMAKYFFTGGIMPSDHLLLYFCKDFRIERHWRVNGTHYQKTADAWLKNMDAHRGEIQPLFAAIYGEKEVSRWWSYWRIFFMSCSELWGYEDGNEWFVSHYLFQKS